MVLDLVDGVVELVDGVVDLVVVLDWLIELWSWLWCPLSRSHSRNCSRPQYLPWTTG